jgi:dTMP kinase
VVDTLHDTMIGVEPDLTLIIDMDPAAALGRARARLGRGSLRGVRPADFQEKLRAGFLALAAEAPARCVVVDASAEADAVAARIAGAVDDRLALPG